MDAAISIQNVTKRFADETVVDCASVEVPMGVVYGLLRPNGAGKTTIIMVLSKLVKSSAYATTLWSSFLRASRRHRWRRPGESDALLRPS